MTTALSVVDVMHMQRAPNGVDSKRRLRVALMPSEREELERRALAEGRSISALARLYLLRGMSAADEVNAIGCGTQPHSV
jgi:hypothetical protein